MTDLIKRLEEAREPSRELDAEISAARSGRDDAFVEQSPFNGAWCVYVPCKRNGKRLLECEKGAYTSSVDAALSLVPEGWRRRVMVAEDGRAGVQLCHIGDGWPSDIEQLYANEALATCIASLRAKEVEDGQ